MKNLLTICVLLVGSSAMAATKPVTMMSNNGYGMAGCGLGSLVFQENNSTQILAATTNGTFGSQTFGITFGTSNCGGAGKLVSKERVENYVAANENTLKNDIARGNGEALNGLVTLMGIENSDSFKANLKANYSKIASSSSKELANTIYNF